MIRHRNLRRIFPKPLLLEKVRSHVNLINFQYLRRKRILTLIVILTLISTLFSITAYSFLGFYNGFTNYVGEQKNIVAIYSGIGSTPFTGVIPIAAENEIATLIGCSIHKSGSHSAMHNKPPSSIRTRRHSRRTHETQLSNHNSREQP